MTLGASSCSDMLEVDSPVQLSNQDITNKTDSVFYTFGVMNAMQQLAESYVLQNELRGDMVSTTSKSDLNLQALANFTVDQSNKYDSAYLYYKVINNVNYYAAHRDTTLKEGSTNVVLNEYAAMLTFRAWAYLQAVRTFGHVKYFTHPLTTVSDIESDNSPVLGREELVRNLINDLAPYSGQSVPNYGSIDCGTTNKGTSKTAASSKCFIPVDVMLGELYLELGDKASCLQAVNHYYNYLVANEIDGMTRFPSYTSATSYLWNDEVSLPIDFPGFPKYSNTGNIWSISNTQDIISYIPMAANRLTGTTSDLSKIFGYDYYSADSSYISDIQVVASERYHELADNSAYYYVSSEDNLGRLRKSFAAGDVRRVSTIWRSNRASSNVEYQYIDNYYTGNIVLYRTSTIWLHLAEALNRAGYPDAAFAILKDGLSTRTAERSYITDETKALLSGTFFSVANSDLFDNNTGIHGNGCDPDGVAGGYSPYQMSVDTVKLTNPATQYATESIVGEKIADLEDEFGLSICETKTVTLTIESGDDRDAAIEDAVPEGYFRISSEIKNITNSTVIGDDGANVEILNLEVSMVVVKKEDVINAVEDLICDEYAMELPFMGSRFADLSRMARHKNAAGLYGSNFGSVWLDRKVKKNNPSVAKDLTNEQNWYLPFN